MDECFNLLIFHILSDIAMHFFVSMTGKSSSEFAFKLHIISKFFFKSKHSLS